jgi:hypothetical protein
VVASVFGSQSGAQIGVTGGAGGGTGVTTGASGGGGRFVLGRSTTQGLGGLSLSGELVEMADTGGRHLGTREMNPFVFGFATETPYIPGLAEGAELFGLTSRASTDADIASMLTQAPAGAKGALILMDTGPAGLTQNWDGFDMLLLVNLTDTALTGPRLGAGRAGYLLDTLVGGFARDPAFGGTGYDWLDELPAHGVYATLVPEGSTEFSMAFNDANIPCASANTLVYNQPVYDVVPEPATLSLLALGGLMALRRRR